MLSIRNHSRDSAGMTYVYPVISRRAGGVSVGINLNVNNACNWACRYCQVPNLKRGKPPAIDLALLEAELAGFLNSVVSGDFLQTHTPPEARKLVDIAFSGNGEPTSAPEFSDAVDIAGKAMRAFHLTGEVKLRLITNGSLMHRAYVRQGIAKIGRLNGEVWFKVDRGSRAGTEFVNGISLEPEKVRKSIRTCAGLTPTWLQSCFLAIDGKAMDEAEFAAYLDLVSSVRDAIKGIHLYGLARPSLQPEADRLSALSAESLSDYAKRISVLGINVVISP